MRPDRVVIGTDDARAQDMMRELYRPLIANKTPIVFTERRGAELIKYAANAFLATKITFINEIADLCEQAGADVQEVAQGIGLDNRIGPKFLNAGPGYGGSCFPKDLLALLRTGLDFGVPIRSIETIISINEQRKRAMARKVIAAVRRQRARQHHRRAGPHLQAGHRRHARGALGLHHHGPAGCRRHGSAPSIPRA